MIIITQNLFEIKIRVNKECIIKMIIYIQRQTLKRLKSQILKLTGIDIKVCKEIYQNDNLCLIIIHLISILLTKPPPKVTSINQDGNDQSKLQSLKKTILNILTIIMQALTVKKRVQWKGEFQTILNKQHNPCSIQLYNMTNSTTFIGTQCINKTNP